MKTRKGQPICILLADDDEDDCALAREALAANRLANDLHVVSNGEELMAYLLRQGKFADPNTSPVPGMILLDLNMPLMDGREALIQIKSIPELRHIPIVILTTSQAEQDIFTSYNLGASSFITKPVTFPELVKVLGHFKQYWLEIVQLPEVSE
jgi:CheY-like chemotaxis protein